MKLRTFGVFAAATVVMVAAAVWAVLAERAPTTVVRDRDPVFPALAERLNDAAEIEVVSNKATFTVKKAGEKWVVVEKGDYPARFDKVRGAMVKLAEAKYFERKTEDPGRFDRLQVQDPKAKDSLAKKITVKDSKGELLAAAVVGKISPNLFGASGGGTYLRKADENQVWLAEGEVEFGAQPIDWLFRDLVNILEDDVKSMTYHHPDGEVLHVHKAKKGDETFVVDNIPTGRKLKSKSEPNGLSTGMWRMLLEDVKPAKEFDFPADHAVADYVDFEGFHVTAQVAHIGDEYWAKFHAKQDPVEGLDDKAKKKVADKVAEINARTEGWVYRTSAGEGERLSTRMKDILAEPKKEAS